MIQSALHINICTNKVYINIAFQFRIEKMKFYPVIADKSEHEDAWDIWKFVQKQGGKKQKERKREYLRE